MKLLQHGLALLLAILIANPLCCCFAQSVPAAEEKAHSCCSRDLPVDEEAPPGDPCPGCQIKNPRVADGGKTLPFNVELSAIPAIANEICEPRFSLRELNFPLAAAVPPPQPPRLILALQQRFLI